MLDLNSKRKKLLSSLDKGEVVNNLDLAMYDLTPYLTTSSLNDSLTDVIVDVKKQLRPIHHIFEHSFYFSPEQQLALEHIDSYSRTIISAPTSFGKTMIVKEYIYRYKPKNIVYIVPTNSLAYELENSFKKSKSFQDYKIFDRKKDECNDMFDECYTLFIGTQEKYIELKNHIATQIDLFVIDEAYKLQETTKKSRGYKLSESFLNSIHNNSKKIVLLTPNASFEGFEKYEFIEFHSTYNAVDKNFHQIESVDFFEILKRESKLAKTILYCDAPSDINDIEPMLPSLFTIDSDIEEFINFLENEYHDDWTVIKFLKKGILVHHGQMPKFVQNRIINIFNKNDKYNLLIGTNSISEGINTPAKNVFINVSSSRVLKDILLLKNTVGRAGRLGTYPIGHIYSVNNIEDIVNNSVSIKLSISSKEEIEELENIRNKDKIKLFCENNLIEEEFFNLLVNKTHLSMTILDKIMNVLSTDQQYDDYTSICFMAVKVFREYYNKDKLDKFYLKGLLQYYYINENDEKVLLNNFKNKIMYFKSKNQDLTDSEIVDGYMKFMYSTLDNYILPIVKVGMEIKEMYPNWRFGNNVIKIITFVITRYNELVVGIKDFDLYSNEEKIIIQTLRDYGIATNKNVLNKGMIKEINDELNVRYSCYDILKAIEKLSFSSTNYKEKFKFISDTYIR